MDCFVNVEQAIAKSGGRAIYGWAIWQELGVYIEAEFHCVWENDAGEMLEKCWRNAGCDPIPLLYG